MLYVMGKEWEKIDYWRINKFMLMFRMIMEEIFKLCRHYMWK
jgi:ribosomal RNA-processing protein 1